ncbi:hypothetical protein CPLU01_14713, partial [Colletotrichum plurivorum]
RAEIAALWATGARVYVCGSREVGKAVEEAFVRVLVEEKVEEVKGLDDQGSRKWFEGMRNVRQKEQRIFAMYQPIGNSTTGPPARDDQTKPDYESFTSPPRTKRRRLGLLIRLSTTLSLASLVLALAFISWLWWAPRDDPRWRRWVLVPNRLQLSVNVASLVVRTAIGTLAASAAAMLASVAVERCGVRLHAVAQVSITRFASNGSLSLAALALQDSISSFFLRMVLLCLALTTIASQFTSTLLVADLERGRIGSFPKQASGAYCAIAEANSTSDPVLYRQQREYWMQTPRLSETYAEYAEAGVAADGVDDTGLTLRAFLPFTLSETRERLQVFQGEATVVNSRFTCVRPEVSNLEVFYRTYLYSVGPTISGTVNVDGLLAEGAFGLKTESLNEVEFNCSILLERYTWQYCQLGWFDKNWPKRVGNFSGHDRGRLVPIGILWDAGNLATSSLPMNRGMLLQDRETASLNLSRSDITPNAFKLEVRKAEKSGPWARLTLDEIGFLDGMRRMAKCNFIRINTKWLIRNNFEENEIREIQSAWEAGRWDDAQRLTSQRIPDEDAALETNRLKELFRRLDQETSNAKNKSSGGINLGMTVCADFGSHWWAGSDPSRLSHLKILATSTESRREASYGLAAGRDVYNTSVARTQLGALSGPATTNEDRQIMSISPGSLEGFLTHVRKNETYSETHGGGDKLLQSWFKTTGIGYSILFHSGIAQNRYSAVNQGYSDLLNDTIHETDSPARALQAVYFSKARQVYNDFINLMPARDDSNITVSTFEPATVPGRRRAGYWAVVGISAAFLVCWLVIRVLFDSTESSLPDNAWHTVAQVSESAEMAAILSISRTKRDKEVVEICRRLKDDEDEEDRFVVRGGVFARASTSSAAAKDGAERESRRRRR